ncbi:MAG: pyridoxal phosphate-dependent aminotransferase [bacterium]|jgi:aspartate aminotransferase
MTIARTITAQLERASWIRKMFEEGTRLRAQGREVYDFTLGNPDLEPPAAVTDALQKYASSTGLHGYMPNAGFPRVREVIAERMSRATGLGYTADHIIMTVGSAGAINTVLKAILDPGDEVMVLTPYFPEYRFYIENHQGRMVEVHTDDCFRPDPERIAKALTPRTRALILNTPNNPSGALYTEDELRAIDGVLAGTGVIVIADEPYRSIVFDGREMPETSRFITRCVTARSWSKSQGLAGERIGFIAISPRLEWAEELRNACTFTNRILGYINAPAIWQWVECEAGDAAVDSRVYESRRNLLWDELMRIGYRGCRPEGAFYLFPQTPVPDDVAFVRRLQREGVLTVPGSGFARPGHLRISLTVPDEVLERAIPGFERAFRNPE